MTNNNPPKPRFAVLAEFKKSHLSLRKFISRYMISPQDIDDVSQETFLRAFKAEKTKQIEQPKAFLFKIAKNLILSEFSRKTKKVTDYIEDYSDEESLFNGDELESEMIALQKLGIYCEALVALPTQCRRVIIMKKVYGMKNKDIAIRLDISISTVEKHLSKGIRQSASMLASRYESSKTDNNQTEDNVKEMK